MRAGRNLAPRSIRFVRELAPGLRHWQARHPQWSKGEPWPFEPANLELPLT